MRNSDANPHRVAKCYCYCDSNSYAYTDSYANGDGNSYAYTDSYAYGDANFVTASNADGPAEIKPDTKATPDTAAAPVGGTG